MVKVSVFLGSVKLSEQVALCIASQLFNPQWNLIGSMLRAYKNPKPTIQPCLRRGAEIMSFN